MSTTTDDDDDECSTISEAEAERIKLLARVAAIDLERSTISAADEWAPDRGGLFDRYQELCDDMRAAARDLCRLGPPETVGAIKVLAGIVLDRCLDRKRDGTLETDDFSTWLELAVIVGVSGRHEQIRRAPIFREWLSEVEEDTRTEPAEVPA